MWGKWAARRGSCCGTKGKGRRELTRATGAEVTGERGARVWVVGRNWWLKTEVSNFFCNLWKFCICNFVEEEQ